MLLAECGWSSSLANECLRCAFHVSFTLFPCINVKYPKSKKTLLQLSFAISATLRIAKATSANTWHFGVKYSADTCDNFDEVNIRQILNLLNEVFLVGRINWFRLMNSCIGYFLSLKWNKIKVFSLSCHQLLIGLRLLAFTHYCPTIILTLLIDVL